MKTILKKTAVLPLFILVFNCSLSSQGNFSVTEKLWKPVADDVFLQESARKIITDKPVLSVAFHNDQLLAVMGNRIWKIADDIPVIDQGSPEGVDRLINAGEELWALASSGIYRFRDSKWQRIDTGKYVDICLHLGKVHAAKSDEIFRLDNDRFVSIKPEGGYNSSDMTVIMEDGSQVHAEPVTLGPVSRIQSYSGTIYVLEQGKLVMFDGLMVNRDFVDWGSLPSFKTRDMLSWGSRLYIATEKGLAVMRGAAITSLKGSDGLPVENTTCLARGFDTDLWIGTADGLVRMLPDEWHYFGAGHWLPGDYVNDVAVGNKIVCAATDKGISIISYEPYTLLKKADYFEKHIDEWGHKRLGFIHKLYKKGDEWIREISDNDGGHTAPYLAAMSYKYAVTGDMKAREEAVDAFNAMIWLDRITPVDGFIARAIYSPTADEDKMATQGSGGLPAKWYKTKDGKWFWKGDTSSDEVIAHFYSVSLFYDLAAVGKEKDLAREHLRRIASYIVDNGWVYLDMDGKATRWGRWNPEYLLRPYGYVDRGVNSLEALTFMQTAYRLTGEKKFREGLDQLIRWGYDQLTIRQKNTFPPETIAPWDDNLAFESYNTILRYTTDPVLRSVLLRSLNRTWEVKRMYHTPWINFSYGALTGNDCELEKSVKYMREYKLDCIEHNFRNSDRDDLYPEPGYTSYEGAVRTFSPRESSGGTNPDGGTGGRTVKDPSGFLRDYWMARYHGFIKAPEVTNAELISVKSSANRKGAKPYNGPGRPAI